ncbi:MAG: TRAP transporter substrate-binding protein, partial [Proteobacteria bacterium]|nr:TRAP transporter substrate-binding protein [Pseudomonadota bacterium]
MQTRRLIMALALALAPATALAQQTIVIKFSHVVAAETPKGKGAEHFKKLAEERTKGRVKVEVYPNSTLYRDVEEMQPLQVGAVQMLAPTFAKLVPLGAKEFELFDLPYVFANYNELHRVTQGPIGRQLLGKLENKGILGLALWDNGFKQMSANKPLKSPDDFKGLKMRVQQGSRALELQMRAMGATPQGLPLSEVAKAVQAGVIDGTENPLSNFYTQKIYEVQKYLTLSDHGYLGYAVIVNKKFWDGLPPDIRATLEGAMKDTTTLVNDIAKKENDDALEAVKKSGRTQILTLTPQEKGEW